MRYDYTASGTTTVLILRCKTGVWFIPNQTGHPTYLPESVCAELNRIGTGDDWEELAIEISAKGYYDPGRTYGPPEKCYPPEGSEEREVVRMEICGSCREENRALSKESQAILEELLNSDIEAANLESDEPEPWPV